MPLGKYHGAEHKVFNAYLKGKILNIENVKKEDRVCDRCGSNLIMFMLLLSPVAWYLITNPLISMFIVFSISYELFKVKNKTVRRIFRPIYFAGETLQKYVLTTEPTEKELEVAIISINILLYQDLLNEIQTKEKREK